MINEPYKRNPYRQCQVQRKEGKSTISQTTYLPEKFAQLNHVLKLKNENDKWENGWVVVQVSATAVDEAMLPDYRKAIRTHRKNTGDNLPKSE